MHDALRGSWLPNSTLRFTDTRTRLQTRLHMPTPQSRPARHTEKMIELTVRFWTNDIAKKDGEIIPKHAWDSGVVSLQKNESHGIEPENPKPFHSLMEMNAVIEKVLIAHGVKLKRARRSLKYSDSV